MNHGTPKIPRVLVDLWDNFLHTNRVLLIVSLNEVNRTVEGIWQPGNGFDYPRKLTGAEPVQLDHVGRYYITAVTLFDEYSSRRFFLTAKTEVECWTRIKAAFRLSKRQSGQPDISPTTTPTPQEKDVVWVGPHKTYHPAITDVVEKYADPFNAVLIWSGSDLDLAITKAYQAKRAPSPPSGEEVS